MILAVSNVYTVHSMQMQMQMKPKNSTHEPIDYLIQQMQVSDEVAKCSCEQQQQRRKKNQHTEREKEYKKKSENVKWQPLLNFSSEISISIDSCVFIFISLVCMQIVVLVSPCFYKTLNFKTHRKPKKNETLNF